MLLEARAQFVDACLDHGAVLADALLGEEVGVGVASATMDVVIDGREDAIWGAEHGDLGKASAA